MTNTDTQHTVRPWEYNQGLINTYVTDITGKDNYRLIADVDVDTGQTMAERDYIGNLIAAAPELLACLETSTNTLIAEREFLYEYITDGNFTEQVNDKVDEFNHLIDANQKVITKATGGDI